MHRSEKEIKDENEIAEIMQRAAVCKIALVDGDYPYIIPVNYAYHEYHLYFHSAKEGKKIDILCKNNNICFAIDVDTEIVQGDAPCNWGTKYRSVIGFGRAFFIEKQKEKMKALDYLMTKFAGGGPFVYKEESLEKVLLIDIIIDKVTGKKSGY